MRSWIVLSSIASFFLVGCSQELSEKDAQVAFAATYTTLSVGGAAAQASAGTPVQADESPAFRAGAAASVDYDYNCLGGGTAHLASARRRPRAPRRRGRLRLILMLPCFTIRFTM